MTLKEIICTKQELEMAGYSIENNIIKRIDINTIAHFNNSVCLEIRCKDVMAASAFNNTDKIGYIIKAIIELFDLSREAGVRLSDLSNIPCRLVFKGSRCVGFGHFMNDKFVITSDLVKISDDTETNQKRGVWVNIVWNERKTKATGQCSRCRVVGDLRLQTNSFGALEIGMPFCPECGAAMMLGGN